MNQHKRDKIQMQKKVQGLYRKKKQQRSEDMDHMNDYSDLDDNKIGIIIVRICVVLGILVLLLNAFFKDF